MLEAWLRKPGVFGTAVELARVEDVLTSHVFGLLRYLPVDHGIGPLLGALGLPAPKGSVSVDFWPLRDGTEPDVVLRYDRMAVLVEAKLDSGFGDRQLGREWRWLAREHPRARRVLVTLTRDRLAPTAIVAQVADDLDHLDDAPPPPSSREVRSLRWREILPALPPPRSPAEHAIHTDLAALLARAGERARPFQGWPPTPPTAPAHAAFFRARPFQRLVAPALPSPWRLR
ncbi:MAG: hypothetical protein H6732_07365 [Alphaproteobacteria bacterium]|nr:hypothetical protein [Alphaproteobacteria bacterium]